MPRLPLRAVARVEPRPVPPTNPPRPARRFRVDSTPAGAAFYRASVSAAVDERDVPFSELVRAFVRVFLPSLARDPNAYAGRMQFQPAGDELPEHDAAPWYPLAKSVSADDAIRAHLAAGESHEPRPLGAKGRLVRAIGARHEPGDVLAFLHVDLDGQAHEPRAVLSALHRIGARFLVTPGSGRPGRFRVLARLSEPLPVDELQRHARRLFAGLGFPVCPGGVEVYPGPSFSRLPFGLGGCGLYVPETDPASSPGIALPPSALLRAFLSLRPFDLARAAEKHGAPDESPPPRRRARARRVGASHVPPPADVVRWLARGAEPEERQRAIKALVLDRWWLGFTPAACVSFMRAWVMDQGGIVRTRYGSGGLRALERQARDLPRIVRNLYRLASTWKVSRGAGAAANLAPADVLGIASLVDAAAKLSGATARRVGSFALAILPSFKAAALAGRVDELGRPTVRIHRDVWKRAAGGKQDYARIRAAFGLFAPVSGYLPTCRASRPERAHATTWAASFRFAEHVPPRALGRSWETAIDRARRARTTGPACARCVSPAKA